MIQARFNVFETNSSSTHSIVISKAKVKHIEKTYDISPCKKYFGYDNFGWEIKEVDPNDYLFTNMIYAYAYDYIDENEFEELKDRIREVCSKHHDIPVFDMPTDIHDCWEEYGIDHFDMNFLRWIFNNSSTEDRLERYLYGSETHVYTGNDNEDSRKYESTYGIASAMVLDDNWELKKNPYHDEKHYEYYMKGN